MSEIQLLGMTLTALQKLEIMRDMHAFLYTVESHRIASFSLIRLL